MAECSWEAALPLPTYKVQLASLMLTEVYFQLLSLYRLAQGCSVSSLCVLGGFSELKGNEV